MLLAGPVRFELTMGFPTPVFKTGAFNHSATDPWEAADHIIKPAGINPLFPSGFIETLRLLG